MGLHFGTIAYSKLLKVKDFLKFIYVVTAAGQDQSGLHPHWNPFPHGFPLPEGEVPIMSIPMALLDFQPPSAPTPFLSIKCLFSLFLSPFS